MASLRLKSGGKDYADLVVELTHEKGDLVCTVGLSSHRGAQDSSTTFTADEEEMFELMSFSNNAVVAAKHAGQFREVASKFDCTEGRRRTYARLAVSASTFAFDLFVAFGTGMFAKKHPDRVLVTIVLYDPESNSDSIEQCHAIRASASIADLERFGKTLLKELNAHHKILHS
jgi:hypothetical protein